MLSMLGSMMSRSIQLGCGWFDIDSSFTPSRDLQLYMKHDFTRYLDFVAKSTRSRIRNSLSKTEELGTICLADHKEPKLCPNTLKLGVILNESLTIECNLSADSRLDNHHDLISASLLFNKPLSEFAVRLSSGIGRYRACHEHRNDEPRRAYCRSSLTERGKGKMRRDK